MRRARSVSAGRHRDGISYAIQAQGLVKRFGGTPAPAGVNFQVAQGTVLGLLGLNGSGKTTAIRILATLLRADEGRAEAGGYDVVKQAHQVRQLIGLTGQYAAVDDGLTGHDNLTGDDNLLMIGRLLGTAGRRSRPARPRARPRAAPGCQTGWRNCVIGRWFRFPLR